MQRSEEETIVGDQSHADWLHVIIKASHFLTNLFYRLNAAELRDGYQPPQYWPYVKEGVQ